MSHLTLVRHGQASFLADDYDQLSERGLVQSERLGKYWSSILNGPFDLVVYGPAKRHLQVEVNVLERWIPRDPVRADIGGEPLQPGDQGVHLGRREQPGAPEIVSDAPIAMDPGPRATTDPVMLASAGGGLATATGGVLAYLQNPYALAAFALVFVFFAAIAFLWLKKHDYI